MIGFEVKKFDLSANKKYIHHINSVCGEFFGTFSKRQITVCKVEILGFMSLKNLLFILFMSMVFSAVLSAKIINVPSDYKLINDALANADAGDTVLVRRGTYNENVTLIMGVVLKGEDPLTTIIDGGRRGPAVHGTSGAEISHFTIRNGMEGVLCENAAPYIHHCWIIDNHATGIAAFISLPKVRNNVVYGNRWSGILAWGAKSLDAKIEQNVVLRNGFSGMTLKGPSNIIVRNNIFMENHYYGIFADPASGQTNVEFNNIYKNYYPFNRFIKVNRTNVSLDPVFINPSLSKPNFFVASRSPMVKRGKGKLDIGLLEREEVAVEDGDRDGDGLPDSEDACPDDAEDFDGFEDEDGCPDLDNDGDGITDADDKCPNEAEDFDGFEDTDGCPEPDNDGDGLCDPWVAEKGMASKYAATCKGSDKCPDHPETINEYKDDDGCPDQVPVQPKKTFTLDGINFKSGSAEITEDSYPSLRQVVDQLEAFPESKFTITGYTDNRGNAAKNKQLSLDRANSVKAFLVENGIGASRLSTEGKGDANPVASNQTAEGRMKNRRIEFYRK
jgi:outer membrane protein OmpA-like peptidoglycan-associated protein